MPSENNTLDIEVVVPLKYLRVFWRSFDLTLINFGTEIVLRWTNFCIIYKIPKTSAMGGADPALATETSSTRFEINCPKLCVPIVTL